MELGTVIQGPGFESRWGCMFFTLVVLSEISCVGWHFLNFNIITSINLEYKWKRHVYIDVSNQFIDSHGKSESVNTDLLVLSGNSPGHFKQIFLSHNKFSGC